MSEKPLLTVGVLSDTHLPHRLAELPPEISQIFASVDLILHAGDVDEIAYLHPLESIAPIDAVRGNVHLQDFSLGGKGLPLEIELSLAGKTVIVNHGHRPGILGFLLKPFEILESMLREGSYRRLNGRIIRRLCRKYPQADVVIFGHTHTPCYRQIDGTVFFNPGAVSYTPKKIPSVGKLIFYSDRLDVEIVPLTNARGAVVQCGSFPYSVDEASSTTAVSSSPDDGNG